MKNEVWFEMRTRKVMCAVAGAMMAASLFAGCGKQDEKAVDVKNAGSTQVSQMQDSSSEGGEKQTEQSVDLLDSQFQIFSGYTAQIPKGYSFTGQGGKIIFNSKDKTDLYISRSFEKKSTLPLTSVTQEVIAKNISDLLWIDDGIGEHISGYKKNVPVTVTSITDIEVNGIQMKKFEGKLTLAKSSSEKETTWDCYIYGYVFETGINTVSFFGLEQEQSQPSDKIELIKKNMDAMIKTVKLI